MPAITLADTLNWLGEDTSIDQYQGTNKGDSLWDAVYSITDWSHGFIDPTAMWGVITPTEPVAIYQSTGWTGYWTSSLPTYEADYLKLPEGAPAVVWEWDYDNPPSDASYFHFQSTVPTVYRQRYGGDGWSGNETTYSNPEPASTALLGLSFLGIALWRKRQVRVRS
jgi:hypothetical protein